MRLKELKMNKYLQSLCGCIICNGNCQANIDRQRTDEINFLTCNNIASGHVKEKDREVFRSIAKNNLEVFDCIIILKRIKRILWEQKLQE